jgi:hypothetical protein
VKFRRVLFAGDIRPVSTCLPRLRGLESLGLDIAVLDTVNWAGSSRVAQVLSNRTWVTPTVLRMNRDLLAMAAKHRPDVVWIEKGTWVHPIVLRMLRRHARFLVHYNTDDLLGHANRFGLARLGIRRFDAHLTTNRFNVKEIKSRFGIKAMRVGMGFDQDLHRPPKTGAQGLAPGAIVFLGHCEPHTENYILALCDAGLTPRVWGGAWHRARTPAFRRFHPCALEEYTPTIASAAVALCFLSRANRNESTGRSFEIPAIGTCMLAERTAEHEFLYREGVDACFFASAEELVRKARYLLDHAEERRMIAASGQARCNQPDLSWKGHMTREWPLLERLLAGETPKHGVEDAPFWPGYRAGEPYVVTTNAETDMAS